MTGFKGRSGRSFRARLALEQSEEGKWRVEFDEPWAREGAKPPEAGGRGEAEAPAAEAGGAGRGGVGAAARPPGGAVSARAELAVSARGGERGGRGARVGGSRRLGRDLRRQRGRRRRAR